MPDAREADAEGGTPDRRRTRGVVPEPSEASKGRPVPKPLRRRSAAGRGAPPAQGAEAEDETSAGETAAGPGPPPVTDGWPRGSITRQTASHVTRPGITQASLGGGAGGAAAGGFTTQRVRSEDRVNVTVDVTVSYRFVSPRDPGRFPARFRGKLLDISLAGAQIEGPIAADVGRDELRRGAITVEAAFELPFVEGPLEIAANVNWIKPSVQPLSYMGLKFLKPTAEQKRIVRAFLIGLQSPTRRKFRGGR